MGIILETRVEIVITLLLPVMQDQIFIEIQQGIILQTSQEVPIKEIAIQG